MRKIWLLVLGFMIVGGSAAWWFWPKDNAGRQPAAANVATAPVRKGTLEVKVSGTGSIQPAARESITADTSATVEEVLVQQGDQMKKGDVLITFEQTDNSDKIRSNELDLKSKQLDLEQLQSRYKQSVMDGNDANAAEQKIAIEKLKLEMEKLQADTESLRNEAAIEPVVSPMGGTITALNVKIGQNVNPNTVLADIVDYKNLQMAVGVDELDISKVKVGQEAEISVEAIAGKSYAGKVVSVAEEGTQSNGVASFDVTVAVTAPEQLKAGMSAEASIMTDKKDDALYVPIEAVQSFRGQYFVMLASAENAEAGTGRQADGSGGNSGSEQRGEAADRPQRAGGNRSSGFGMNGGGASGTRVQVEVGIHNEDYIEIVSGLSEGDAVVLPTVTSTSANNSRSFMMPGGGFGGFGGGAVPGGLGGGAQGRAGRTTSGIGNTGSGFGGGGR
ncbi:efflux RND transporter periplasmic adaptor subunit [Paenibacillus thermotolerans]|uniref:efflux RND transporter periplasmic adaptor subunit n=1 Tax=Paenibacillus thermotolerans TaxID=3027807 RepID=UPI002368A832|nr:MULTISPECIES: efflux RND transporter periplasmic adaptor subunit [unclassified Paenibacillus]